MAVRAGYKQTEIGLIPEDWDIDSIDNVAQINTGGRNTQDRIDDGKYPFFVRSQTVEHINTYSFDGEAVLTAGDGVGTGKVFHYINGKFDAHQRVYRITDFSEKVKGYYFFLYFSNHFYNRIMQMTAKSSVDSVRMEMIAKMFIPIPPLAEQEAIAAALSDADALIAALEGLITKKRQIKQGAMQELLSVESGEWRVKSLGDVLTLRYGKSQKGIVVEDGKYPILATSGEVGRTNEYLYDKPSVIIGRKGTIDEPQYIDTPFWTIDTAYYSEISKQANPKFLFYLLSTIEWYSYNEASGVPSLNAKTVESIEVSIPELPEQTAIAEILSDMDAEIEMLAAKLSKVRQVKQGMMSELLTGKVRLV